MRLIRVRMVVDDFDTVFAFYRRSGMELTGLTDEDEIRRIGHATFWGGPETPVVEVGRGNPEASRLCFNVDDLDSTLNSLLASGGTVVVEPHEEPNRAGAEVRSAQVRDPAGTLLELRWGRRGPLHAR